MSILNSLVVLQNAVEKAVKRDIAKDISQTLADGFVDWSNTTLLLEDVGLSDLLSAKNDGDLFSTPKSLYASLLELVTAMETIHAGRRNDYQLYAEITGQTLDSVLKHKVDKGMKPVRAKDADGNYIYPALKKAQEARNSALVTYDKAKTELSLVMGSINLLSKAEQTKLKPVLAQAKGEIDDFKSHANVMQAEVEELVETYKSIEETYGYELDANGKRVYPKHEFNQKYSKLLATGRTTLAKLRKYLDMFMIDNHIPSLRSDYKRAEKVFGLVA